MQIDSLDTPAAILDADVVIYVIAERLQSADRDALAMVSPANAVAVLNKADAVSSHWSDVVVRANDTMKITGVQTVPLVAPIGGTTSMSTVGDQELRDFRILAASDDPTLTLSPDLFAAAEVPVNTRDRLALLSRWELAGVTTALDTMRREPNIDAARLTQILHAFSGVDAAKTVVAARVHRSAALRGGALLDTLEKLAARSSSRDPIEQFLRGPTAAELGLAAGLASPALVDVVAGRDARQPVNAAEALRLAEWWTRYAASDVGAPSRRAANRIRHGYSARSVERA
ncbi:hypothetical protein FOY51_26505 [Antrihabitans cavernicola]|uniref:Uncharacterized protein n=1 Tax=Antrihabitans cavernicola TaxID=2495913 RepID=A0A5A7S460_9NOCA|nr:hypothetical protein FOY51_26505 [Spelaeibacter cavernicola]